MPASIKLDNASAWALQIGLGGDTHWLPAWRSDLYQVPTGISQMIVTPLLVMSPGPTSSLFVTVAAAGERIPGIYPADLLMPTTPNTIPLALNLQPGANSAVDVILKQAGQTIRIYALHYVITAAAGSFGRWRDTALNTFCFDDWSVAGVRPFGSMEGAPLTTGEGLQLANSAGIAMAGPLKGLLVYTQQ